MDHKFFQRVYSDNLNPKIAWYVVTSELSGNHLQRFCDQSIFKALSVNFDTIRIVDFADLRNQDGEVLNPSSFGKTYKTKVYVISTFGILCGLLKRQRSVTGNEELFVNPAFQVAIQELNATDLEAHLVPPSPSPCIPAKEELLSGSSVIIAFTS